MKVYEVSTTAKPAIGNFSDYASLAARESDRPFLGIGRGEFSGKPFSGKWRKLKLYIDKPRLPRPDFYTFGWLMFVCNERARTIAGEALEMAGELLPVSVEGDKGLYWAFNCTNCINVTDLESSKWRKIGKTGNHRILEKPAFIAERFGEESIFKIPDNNGGPIYCLERTGDPDDGEFKAVVEKHGLTGLDFELIWSGKR